MESTHSKFNIMNTMLPCRPLKMEGVLSFPYTSCFINTIQPGLGVNQGKNAVKLGSEGNLSRWQQ